MDITAVVECIGNIEYIKILDEVIEGLTNIKIEEGEEDYDKKGIEIYYSDSKGIENCLHSNIIFNDSINEKINEYKNKNLEKNFIEVIRGRVVKYKKTKTPVAVKKDKYLIIVIAEIKKYEIDNYEDFKNIYENNKNLTHLEGSFFNIGFYYVRNNIKFNKFITHSLIFCNEIVNLTLYQNGDMEYNFYNIALPKNIDEILLYGK